MILFFVLVACNAPTLAFRGVPVQKVAVGKSMFHVRVNGDHAQAIRVNTEWAPNWSHTAPRFYQAFRIASGCDIRPRSMTGDQVVMEARLKCGSNPAPFVPKVSLSDIECDPLRGIVTARVATLNCTVIWPVAVPESQ